MPRPKKGTKGHEEATAKWRKTMAEKYGDIHDRMVEMGRKGGKISTKGGFASMKVDENGLTGYERARIYGAKGGRISKRSSKKVIEEE